MSDCKPNVKRTGSSILQNAISELYEVSWELKELGTTFFRWNSHSQFWQKIREFRWCSFCPREEGRKKREWWNRPKPGKWSLTTCLEGAPNLGTKDESHCQKPLCGAEVTLGVESCLKAENWMSKYLRIVKCFSPLVLELKLLHFRTNGIIKLSNFRTNGTFWS